jgi:hypothetical protein
MSDDGPTFDELVADMRLALEELELNLDRLGPAELAFAEGMRAALDRYDASDDA